MYVKWIRLKYILEKFGTRLQRWSIWINPLQCGYLDLIILKQPLLTKSLCAWFTDCLAGNGATNLQSSSNSTATAPSLHSLFPQQSTSITYIRSFAYMVLGEWICWMRMKHLPFLKHNPKKKREHVITKPFAKDDFETRIQFPCIHAYILHA